MELAGYITNEAAVLAQQFLSGEIELPAQIENGAMWIALPNDKSILAHGAIRVTRGNESFEFKIGVVMEISDRLKKELLSAIQQRHSDSFKTSVFGKLPHFISAEGKARGLYVCTIRCDEKDFKIYMI